ncbi:FAD-dependent oxidoreductase [Leptolyngbya ohadii]|uniref:FAD-dependent oxidoreductase n=1 Tax=Leptolyngbya ohadii TaxID=1962290 RepID=UPI0019D4AC6C|nr:FAD-dependent oxidoreductase [Leptolyngbya ohadii]
METVMETVDVAVIGAGLAGLTCAQQLRQAGYRVVVIEKSRGLGGRAATRRLMTTCADHGLRYLESQGERSQIFIDRLLQAGVLVPWTEKTHTLNSAGVITVDPEVHPRYAAPNGMSAIAKELAIHLEGRGRGGPIWGGRWNGGR